MQPGDDYLSVVSQPGFKEDPGGMNLMPVRVEGSMLGRSWSDGGRVELFHSIGNITEPTKI